MGRAFKQQPHAIDGQTREATKVLRLLTRQSGVNPDGARLGGRGGRGGEHGHRGLGPVSGPSQRKAKACAPKRRPFSLAAALAAATAPAPVAQLRANTLEPSWHRPSSTVTEVSGPRGRQELLPASSTPRQERDVKKSLTHSERNPHDRDRGRTAI